MKISSFRVFTSPCTDTDARLIGDKDDFSGVEGNTLDIIQYEKPS